MKSWLSTLALVTAICLPLSTGLAQQDKPQNRQPRRPGAPSDQPPGPGTPRGPQARRPGAPGGAAFLEGMLKRWDANGDGKVMLQEIPEPARVRVAGGDVNGDGQLDLQELRQAMAQAAQRPGQRPGMNPGMNPGNMPGMRMGFGMGPNGAGPQADADRLRQMWQRLDKDGDGSVSLEEAPEMLKGRFKQLDANGDSRLDPQEMQAAAQRRGPGNQPGAGPGRRAVPDTRPQRPKRPPLAEEDK